MKLRPYHVPENVDESRVPDGWRFRYADECDFSSETLCRVWAGFGFGFPYIGGSHPRFTYIVPVNA